MIDLLDFLAESNKIEGIMTVSDSEPRVAQAFLDLETIEVPDLVALVQMIAGARLRDQVGLNVTVGGHRPIRGGPQVVSLLKLLLARINASDISAYRAHIVYEGIHPFMDGNGRSGRLLWLWQMQREGLYSPVLSFLHAFYYQTLAAE